VGLITLRTTGPAFLIVTMMLAQSFYLATLYFNVVTGGDQGFILTGLRVDLAGFSLPLAHPSMKYNVALVVFAACLLVSLWITRSPVGRVLAAVRENEERTRLLGYDTARYRLLAVLLSGLLSGVAGSAYTLLFSYVGSTFAGILYSIYPLLWTLLGGAGTVLGPLVGTLLMTYIVDTPAALARHPSVGAAPVMILWAPAGIVEGIRPGGPHGCVTPLLERGPSAWRPERRTRFERASPRADPNRAGKTALVGLISGHRSRRGASPAATSPGSPWSAGRHRPHLPDHQLYRTRWSTTTWPSPPSAGGWARRAMDRPRPRGGDGDVAAARASGARERARSRPVGLRAPARRW
jgi:hypothetical protein